MKRYDFVVIGGGPVGCKVAAKLAKAGHQVAVLERNPSVGGRVCCTGIVSFECLKHFQIPRELVLKELNSASVFSPSGKVLRLERSEMQAAVIDRGAFNAYMASEAQEAGADYLLGHNVKDIVVNPDGVIVYSDSSGDRNVFQARAVALGCGFGSKLSEKLGFEKCKKWTAGVQAEVEAPGLSEIEIFAGNKVAPGYFAWLVPSGGSTALAGLMARRNAGGYIEAFLKNLKMAGKIAEVTGKPGYRGITIDQPRKSYANRVLLIGDASGQVKPLTGGGIYFGLLCADMAADTLHSAIEAGDFSTARLASYQKQWRRLLGRELRLGDWAHSIYSHMSDGRIEWLFEQAARRGLIESLTVSNHIGFDWHGRAMLQMVKRMLFWS